MGTARIYGTETTTMPLRIAFLLFPDVQQLDLTGPYEVFATLDDAEVELVSANSAPVRSSTGLTLVPTCTYATCPSIDVLCVPGGKGVNALLRDEETLSFIRAQEPTLRFLTSVCTGALVLGAAGLLRGKRATTHWNALDLLPAFGAQPVAQRVVADGKVVTGGGVTAGIDFALTIVAELAGARAAEAIQLALEYAPAPPFNSGSPEFASVEVLAAVTASMASTRSEREAILSNPTGASRYATRRV